MKNGLQLFNKHYKMDGQGLLRVLKSECASMGVTLNLPLDINKHISVPYPHKGPVAAVEAMRLGAYSFLEKPVDADMLKPLLRQALVERGRAAPGSQSQVTPLVGVSSVMDEVREFVRTVAPTDETVLIFGETGTGKEVVARQIHAQSSRLSGITSAIAR